MEDIPIMNPLKCKHKKSYFVDSVGDEYCPDCDEWLDTCD